MEKEKKEKKTPYQKKCDRHHFKMHLNYVTILYKSSQLITRYNKYYLLCYLTGSKRAKSFIVCAPKVLANTPSHRAACIRLALYYFTKNAKKKITSSTQGLNPTDQAPQTNSPHTLTPLLPPKRQIQITTCPAPLQLVLQNCPPAAAFLQERGKLPSYLLKNRVIC